MKDGKEPEDDGKNGADAGEGADRERPLAELR